MQKNTVEGLAKYKTRADGKRVIMLTAQGGNVLSLLVTIDNNALPLSLRQKIDEGIRTRKHVRLFADTNKPVSWNDNTGLEFSNWRMLE